MNSVLDNQIQYDSKDRIDLLSFKDNISRRFVDAIREEMIEKLYKMVYISKYRLIKSYK